MRVPSVRWLPILSMVAVACRAPAPPSILWVSLDTVSARHLALYGGRARTPALEDFAEGSVVFEQATTQFPETTLSHWSMFTGVLPEVHGDVPAARASAYAGPTVAALARRAGYATGAFIGGITLQAASSGLATDYDVYDDRIPAGADVRPAAEVVGAARRWRNAQDRPTFTFVHLFDAHFPYTPADPTRYASTGSPGVDGTLATLAPHMEYGEPLDPDSVAYVESLYDAEITELDPALARLLGDLRGDEVVVLTADHGESFDHGYLFNHRAVLWESVLHVPMVVRAPGLAPGRIPGLVGLLDLAPTVARLAGLDGDAPYQGRCLVTGEPGAWTVVVPDREGLWATTDPFRRGGERLLALRSDASKVIWRGDGPGQRWDLRADPAESLPLPVPAELAGPAAYHQLVASMARWHRAPASPTPLPAATLERLRAIGYQEPAPPTPGPPGAP